MSDFEAKIRNIFYGFNKYTETNVCKLIMQHQIKHKIIITIHFKIQPVWLQKIGCVLIK